MDARAEQAPSLFNAVPVDFHSCGSKLLKSEGLGLTQTLCP